jgi:hypothetical protein
VRQGRWSVSGRSWGDLFVAQEDIVREQRVQDRAQLAHAGDQGQLLGFASGEQVQVICAMCDVFTTGRETFEANYKRHLYSWDATLRSKLLANSFSTHTDYKLKAITDRLDEDNKWLMGEIIITNRTCCLCNVLQDVKHTTKELLN